jgi:hypothetical protein
MARGVGIIRGKHYERSRLIMCARVPLTFYLKRIDTLVDIPHNLKT